MYSSVENNATFAKNWTPDGKATDGSEAQMAMYSIPFLAWKNGYGVESFGSSLVSTPGPSLPLRIL